MENENRGRPKKVTADEILDVLNDKGTYTKADLAEMFEVCCATIGARLKELRKNSDPVFFDNSGVFILDKIDNEEKIYALCILYGRINNLSEEMLYGEIHYTFDAISLSGIEISYVPPIEFYFQRFNHEDGPGVIPKASFRGYISDNYIIGMFSVIM